MDAFTSQDTLTERTVCLTLLATNASEELFLTEIHRVLCNPKRRDRIKVTRADGENYFTWHPIQKKKA